MIKINSNYKKLHASYLFSMVSDRVTAYKTENPGADIIKLGIGDVTLPLPAECIKYFRKGVEEMSQDDSFRGYGPYEGYDFLRTAIAEGDFRSRGVDIRDDEIFVSDGAKCDIGNFQELFAADTIVAVQDPVYPVYVDTNVMAGRTGSWKDGRYQGIVYLESDRENNFMPQPPGDEADLIYLCFPNNPTGATAKREELKKWVDYARKKKALILYDAAYEAYIRDDTLPKTIFEIDGARETAVEFRSFSKTAGFTGVRCAYTVIPSECRGFDAAGKTFALREMWARRHSTKFNGVSYPVQKAAEGIYTETGKKQIREMTD